MIRLHTLALLLLTVKLASAQGNGDNLRKAERYYSNGEYYNAAVQYEEYLGIRKSNAAGFMPYAPQKTGAGKGVAGSKTAAYTRLATCYFSLHDYAKAAEYYSKAPAASADAAVNYVVSLRAVGQRAAALEALKAARQQALSPQQQAVLGLEEAALMASAPVDSLFTVSKATGDFNTSHGNYAAVEWGGAVFFTSSRTDSAQKTKGPNRNHLYRVINTDALNADPLPGQAIDQGLCSFTPDGKRIYFTAWKKEGAKNNARIYTCTREDGGWTAPVALNEKVNAPGSSSGQPCYVESNGSRFLLFSSDRPGGQGGYDIWMVTMKDSVLSDALNLGTQVNSAGDEQAPFFHTPTQTLVFASNGRPGLGGFDLFASKQQAATGTDFGPAQNLGAPLNSVKDDSYFFSASPDSLYRKAYMSSDRASDCCLEIFTVTRKDPPAPQPALDLPPAPMPVDTAHVVETPLYTLPVLLFEFDKAELTAEVRLQLDTVFLQLKAEPGRKLRIGGYTDGKGGEGYNNRLSDRRARAVRNYLYEKGIASERLWIKGFGECCPVEAEQQDGQDNPAARARNRRVQLSWEPGS